jgi:hypothetical protein
MISENPIAASSSDNNDATQLINTTLLPPSDVAILCTLCGIFSTGTPDTGFAGIQSFITQDPNTGAQSETRQQARNKN